MADTAPNTPPSPSSKPVSAANPTPPTDNAAEAALQAAKDAITSLGDLANSAKSGPSAVSGEKSGTDANPTPFPLPGFGEGPEQTEARAIDLLSDVNLNVKIELGRTRMLVEDVLRLSEGAVVELDKLAGDPVDIFVNDRHVARGEVLVVNDNFCVRINEVLSAGETAKAA